MKTDTFTIKTRNINPDVQGFTLKSAHYLLFRKAILAVLRKRREAISFDELVLEVTKNIGKNSNLKPGWYTKVVQLDLEAEGLLVRKLVGGRLKFTLA